MNTVEVKALEFDNDIERVKKELKRIASIKCRLKKQKGKTSYEEDMKETIEYENLIKDVRDYLCSKTKSVPQFTEEDVSSLSYDETIRAIKSIQSKKSLSKWLTSVEGNNDEYRNACRVEQLLKEHKETLQPTIGGISRTDIESIIEMSDSLSKDEIVEMLRALV